MVDVPEAPNRGPSSGIVAFAARTPKFQKKLLLCQEPDIAEMLSLGRSSAQAVTGATITTLTGVRPTTHAALSQVIPKTKEALMAGMRSDRARARARHLLATIYPVPDDVELHRLRELAIDYLQEAERLEAESRGRTLESEELISAALDTVARDYFARALARAGSQNRR